MIYVLLFSIGAAIFSYNPLTFLKPGWDKAYCENCNMVAAKPAKTCSIIEDTESLIPNNKLRCE